MELNQKTSYRKPYYRECSRGWWLSRKKYIFYMIRELTAVTNLWLGVELTLFALFCALYGADGQARIISFLSNPCVIAANIVALFGAIYHMATWYRIFPQGVRVFRSSKMTETRLIPNIVWMLSLYMVTILASCIIIYALTLGG